MIFNTIVAGSGGAAKQSRFGINREWFTFDVGMTWEDYEYSAYNESRLFTTDWQMCWYNGEPICYPGGPTANPDDMYYTSPYDYITNIKYMLESEFK